MGFFDKIGKALKGAGNFIAKGVKTAGKVLGQVASVAAPIASFIPGVGIIGSAALGVVGQLLGPSPPEDGGSPSPAIAAGGLVQVEPSGGSGLGLILAAGAALLLLRK